ncbi:MAG: nucleotidyltransferase domain-containing protein [Candidatus Omnitrophota bacterium]|nr:nucleotidyltransferase domain-containing protein [Candidatus Omnitrophota bacterium]
MKTGANGLKKELEKEIVAIILSYKKVEKIVLFGSRAKDNFNQVSDIDLAIFARDWSSKDIAVVKDKLNESLKTPLKLDIMNFYSLDKESLKNSILKQGRILYDSGKN